MLESKKEYMILAKSQPINPPYETGRYVSFSGNCDKNHKVKTSPEGVIGSSHRMMYRTTKQQTSPTYP
jgi:hypothetical protein